MEGRWPDAAGIIALYNLIQAAVWPTTEREQILLSSSEHHTDGASFMDGYGLDISALGFCCDTRGSPRLHVTQIRNNDAWLGGFHQPERWYGV